MDDDQRALNYLAESVARSVANLEKGVKAYVLDSDDSAYGTVSTELRKLLLDRMAVASFRKNIRRANWAGCLLELQYGSGNNILLRSFHRTRKLPPQEYMDVTPDIFRRRDDILRKATNRDRLVSLNEWVEEHLAYDKKGRVLKVGRAIDYIAGREGAHIIDPTGDIRVDVGIAFVSQEPTPDIIPSIDFNQWDAWRQFVIDAGMRLLTAQTRSGSSLISHTIDIPRVEDRPQTLRVQKKRPR